MRVELLAPGPDDVGTDLASGGPCRDANECAVGHGHQQLDGGFKVMDPLYIHIKTKLKGVLTQSSLYAFASRW